MATLLKADLHSCGAVPALCQTAALTEEHAVVPQREALRAKVSDKLTFKVVDTQDLALLERLHPGIGCEEVVLAYTAGLTLYRTVGGRRRSEGGGGLLGQKQKCSQISTTT